ncbi:MAG: hypothetical protein ACOYZ7_00560 [Chloroflexota bacterium]
MQRFESVDWGELTWKQTGLGARHFELRAGEELVGVMYWPRLLSQRAVAGCAVGKWHIERVGLLRQRTVVSEADSGREVASFEPGWLGDGDLTLADGQVLRWRCTDCLSHAWALTGERGQAVLEVKTWLHWFKYRADVVLHAALDSRPDLPLLIFVTWYLGFMHIQDVAAVVATTAACT